MGGERKEEPNENWWRFASSVNLMVFKICFNSSKSLTTRHIYKLLLFLFYSISRSIDRSIFLSFFCLSRWTLIKVSFFCFSTSPSSSSSSSSSLPFLLSLSSCRLCLHLLLFLLFFSFQLFFFDGFKTTTTTRTKLRLWIISLTVCVGARGTQNHYVQSFIFYACSFFVCLNFSFKLYFSFLKFHSKLSTNCVLTYCTFSSSSSSSSLLYYTVYFLFLFLFPIVLSFFVLFLNEFYF